MRLALARAVGAVVLLLAVQAAGIAIAQPSSRMPRIGYISPGASSNPSRVARLNAFRQGLREQGYVEGQNIIIDSRWAQGSSDRYFVFAGPDGRSHFEEIEPR